MEGGLGVNLKDGFRVSSLLAGMEMVSEPLPGVEGCPLVISQLKGGKGKRGCARLLRVDNTEARAGDGGQGL
jgi:hypothetical protein